MWRTECANVGRIEIMKQILSHNLEDQSLKRSIEKDRPTSSSLALQTLDKNQNIEFFLATRCSSAGIQSQKKNSFR